MSAIKGSGSGVGDTGGVGLSEEEIHWIIFTGVVEAFKDVILELFRLVKIALTEEFDRHYDVVR